MTNKQQLAIGYFKEIRLAPTPHLLDVWVCSNTKSLVPRFVQRYGELEGDKRWGDSDGIVLNGLDRITTGATGLVPAYTYRMIMVLSSFDNQTIVHEISHVLMFLSERTGVQLLGADEWCAYFQDYLFELITDIGSYGRLAR